MSKKMLINATLPEEDRVAIVEDGILTELDIEIAERQQTKSNIYKGEVIRVEQGLQAAFVDYGAGRLGFLQIGEIHPSLYPKLEDGSTPTRRPNITSILKRGQQLLVQVVKEERGTKGAALTTELSLPGRYMVLMPESNSRGISRKIDNDSVRKGIKKALAGLELPENMGYIIRTAAIDQPPEELKRDFDYLLNIYNSIISHSETAKAPALIYQESNLVIRSIRDYFNSDIDEILIDDRKVFQEARDFFKEVMPEQVGIVKLHQERRPIFARYQIEEQISQLSSNTVNLPSGGSIVLDQTEALVAIDVNSGKMSSEQDVEATAHRVNVEAASEVARQLRLRDMGGLIVIDFIDMRQRKNAREVEKTLKTALKIDKARVTVGRISHQFGLLEMSRQRIKANLGEGSYHICQNCQGSGRVKGSEARSVTLLRRIQAGTAKGNISKVLCTASVDVVNYLLNDKRRELSDLEQRYKLTICVKADSHYLPEQTELEFVKQVKENNKSNKTSSQEPLVDTSSVERAQAEPVDEPDATQATAEATTTATTEQNEKADSVTEGEKKRPRRRRRPNRRRNEQKQSSEQTSSNTADSATTAVAQSSSAVTASVTQNEQPVNDAINNPPSTNSDAGQSPATTDATIAVTNSAADSTIKNTSDRVDTKINQPVDKAASEQNKQKSDLIAKVETKKPARKRRTPAKRSPTTTVADKTVVDEKDSVVTLAANTESAAKTTTATAIVPDVEKPKRRAPRRKAPTKSASTPATTEPVTTPADKVAEQETPAKKPIRRRSPKKTTATSTAPATQATTEVQPVGSDDNSEVQSTKKPAPKRKTAAKKTTSTTKATKTSPAVAKETTAKEASTATKTPRKSSTTKKTVATKVDNTTTTKSTETAAEKPKRRTTTRKTTTSKGSTTTSPADETKKPQRKRTTTKKTSIATDDAATPEKPKRRKTAAKKVTATIDTEEKTDK